MSGHTNSPLPGYDHLPQSSIQHRIRSLDKDQLAALREYERAHAGRPAVLDMIAARVEQLEQGASPSPGDQERQPEVPPAPDGTSPVGWSTSAEPTAPPRHGRYDQTSRRERP
ncbi:hypothetical protein DI005_17675 [Prauserella sp. PE36]|uniref:DUF8129 domain-containing protein n=1 Tax=Prauserella endophytica TaxID=1592324 RepID=A0ABY2S488_9PSEU|nr:MULTISPECIES: hypothetical protein [Prauserella]PXY23831.1 hypothetical protein BAY59_26575 [Prauserella coralliicola]RBM18918.1 hypothetical protein DI005_17675 [Prauserella sp. PE36]TKG70624.1 hypothetical protein FCN18_17305 [Prauserella endophytica]